MTIFTPSKLTGGTDNARRPETKRTPVLRAYDSRTNSSQG
ncbi:hypothetical protein ATKI12_4153 [Kitasatospora sp. Ki12]